MRASVGSIDASVGSAAPRVESRARPTAQLASSTSPMATTRASRLRPARPVAKPRLAAVAGAGIDDVQSNHGQPPGCEKNCTLRPARFEFKSIRSRHCERPPGRRARGEAIQGFAGRSTISGLRTSLRSSQRRRWSNRYLSRSSAADCARPLRRPVLGAQSKSREAPPAEPSSRTGVSWWSYRAESGARRNWARTAALDSAPARQDRPHERTGCANIGCKRSAITDR